MKRWTLYFALSGLFAAGLSACGGGGSGSGNNSSAQFPVDSAMSAYMQMEHDYTLHGTANGNKYTLQLSLVPEGQAMFGTTSESTSAFTTLRTLAISENGAPVGTPSQTLEFFTISPYRQVGSITQSLSLVVGYYDYHNLPSLVKEGQSGPLDSGTTYAENNLDTPLSTVTDTWALKSGSGDDATLCITISSFSFLTGTIKQDDCYAIDTDGNVLGLTIDLSVVGTQVMFK